MSYDSEGSDVSWSQLEEKKSLADGVHSVVYRERDASESDDREGWIAVKVVSFHAQKSVRPHDVVKEHRFLAELDHANIIRSLDFYINDDLQQYELRMPIIPLSLETLLNSPHFLPFSPIVDIPLPEPPFSLMPSREEEIFSVLVKSLTFQIVSVVAHLHGLEPPIAHRDIKPGNVLIDATGCIKLIDFGLAWDEERRSLGVSTGGKKHYSPYQYEEETAEFMCCQVGSSVYRAPELLFSPDTYDAPDTDLWSLGVTLCDFFTPLRLVVENDWDDDDDTDEDVQDEDSSEEKKSCPLIIPKQAVHSQSTRWRRERIFDPSRGELGLIWSIFKTRGTPDLTTWPDLAKLPSAQAMAFQQVQRIELKSLLPNLPSSMASDSRTSMPDIIERLLVYDPPSRMAARDVLSHSYFNNTRVPLILPPDYICTVPHLEPSIVWEGMVLGDILQPGIELSWKAMGL